MKSYLSIFCLVILLFASVNIYAAKGDTKNKKGVVLKFTGFDLKTFNSQSLFFKNAFTLKSNFTFTNTNSSTTEKAPQTANVNSFITVQRGNTTYIYPYKHKAAITTMFKTPTPPKL